MLVQKAGQASEENTDYPTPPPRKKYFFGLFGGGSQLPLPVQFGAGGKSTTPGCAADAGNTSSCTTAAPGRATRRFSITTISTPGTCRTGLAYHFVIGNGTSTGDGEIEVGNRWKRQINGGHVHSDYLNNIALGICLVGDYNRDVPTRAQYAALDELITYLRKRVGRVDRRLSIVKAHKEINPVPTDCPGNRFSYAWLHRKFD